MNDTIFRTIFFQKGTSFVALVWDSCISVFSPVFVVLMWFDQ